MNSIVKRLIAARKTTLTLSLVEENVTTAEVVFPWRLLGDGFIVVVEPFGRQWVARVRRVMT